MEIPGGLGGAAGFSATSDGRAMPAVVLAQAALAGASGAAGGVAACMGLTGVLSVVALFGGVVAQMGASDATGSVGCIATGLGAAVEAGGDCALDKGAGGCVAGETARICDVVRWAAGIGVEAIGVGGEAGGGTFHNGEGSVCAGGGPDTGVMFACAGMVTGGVGVAGASLGVTGADGAGVGGTSFNCDAGWAGAASGSGAGAGGVIPCSSSFFCSSDSTSDLIRAMLCLVSAAFAMRSL